jgi:pyruvate/2-oxoglutarate dehydrogenase complex dihydrolipoamide dehydrogenase (E3) component
LAQDVLKNPQGVGETVVIVGGGSVGIETAEYLSGLGKKVTVIEMRDAICNDLGPINKADILDRILGSSIELMLNTTVLEFAMDGIKVSHSGQETVLECYDTAIIAAGMESNPLHFDSKIPVRHVGDCKIMGNAMDAIHDAHRVAMTL